MLVSIEIKTTIKDILLLCKKAYLLPFLGTKFLLYKRYFSTELFGTFDDKNDSAIENFDHC